MASSSSDKGESPADVDLKNTPCDACQSCLKPHHDLGGESFKRCAGCRYALYCSLECQAEDWSSGHKNVCKKRARRLAAFREAAPDSQFFPRRDKWRRSSETLLNHLAVLVLMEAAATASRPGAPVTAEDLTRDSCVVVNVDYIPDSLLPFQVRNDYRLVPFHAMEVEGKGDAGIREMIDEMAKNAPADLMTLNLLLNVADTPFLSATGEPRQGFDVLYPMMVGPGRTATDVVNDINSGRFIGAPTKNG